VLDNLLEREIFERRRTGRIILRKILKTVLCGWKGNIIGFIIEAFNSYYPGFRFHGP
jgi:hypothetical protein